MTDAGPEEPQVIVDLGRCSYRGAGGFCRISLFNCNSGRKAVDRVDIRFLHSLEELSCVRGEGFDVPTLTLSVDGIECEGGFSRSARARDDGESSSRNLEIESLEIVLSGPADDDGILHPSNLMAWPKKRRYV